MSEKPSDQIIEAYRQGRMKRGPLALGDVFLILIVVISLAVVGYITFVGTPAFLQFNVQLPDFLVASPTATASLTPTLTSTPTATFTATVTPTASLTASLTPTQTFTPLVSDTPTETLTPIPSNTPTITPIPVIEYTVQPGETIGTISSKFGVTIRQLLLLNNLQPNTLIFPGQKINIPGFGATPLPESSATVAGTFIYTVQSGDNLSSIAAKFGVELRQLELLNNLAPNTLIFLGQQLQIPVFGSTPIPDTTTTP